MFHLLVMYLGVAIRFPAVKNIFLTTILTAIFFRLSAQDLPFLKSESISADWQIRDNASSDFSLGSLNELERISKSALSSPANLNTYYLGYYLIKIQTGNYFFQSPQGPVNTQNIITYSRFDLNVSFSIFNHKTNEYRKKSELSVGLFYQPVYYHSLQYARTDTVANDSLILNYVYYDEWTPMPGIQVSYLVHTNYDKWISAYAGIGIGIGASLHPRIVETYGAMSDKITIDSVGSVSFPNYRISVLSNRQNTFSAKPSLLPEGRIPFGMNLRMLKGLDLFVQAEVMASKQIYLQHGPEFSPIISPSVGAGLKLKI